MLVSSFFFPKHQGIIIEVLQSTYVSLIIYKSSVGLSNCHPTFSVSYFNILILCLPSLFEWLTHFIGIYSFFTFVSLLLLGSKSCLKGAWRSVRRMRTPNLRLLPPGHSGVGGFLWLPEWDNISNKWWAPLELLSFIPSSVEYDGLPNQRGGLSIKLLIGSWWPLELLTSKRSITFNCV